MDENTVLEIINSLRNQIAEVKGQMREQHRQEIERIESAHENEKALLERKCQEEIGGYQDVISRQKGELVRLDRENVKKGDEIVQIKSNLIEKDKEIEQKIEELKNKTSEYNSLRTRFDEKVEEIKRQSEQLTTKNEEISKLRTEIRDINQEKTTIQTTVNNKISEINRLENVIKGKGQEIIDLQTKVENAENECQRLNKYIKDETVKVSKKGDYSKITLVYTWSDMDEDKKKFALEIALKSFNMYSKQYDRAKYIKEQMESRYERGWVVIIKIKYYGYCEYNHSYHSLLNFNIGEYDVTIFKK